MGLCSPSPLLLSSLVCSTRSSVSSFLPTFLPPLILLSLRSFFFLPLVHSFVFFLFFLHFPLFQPLSTLSTFQPLNLLRLPLKQAKQFIPPPRESSVFPIQTRTLDAHFSLSTLREFWFLIWVRSYLSFVGFLVLSWRAFLVVSPVSRCVRSYSRYDTIRIA